MVADRVNGSGEKDSRNGLGKSTLIRIINFCLGSDETANKGIRADPLKNWTFYLDLIIRNKSFTVSRNTTDFGKIIVEGDFSDWPISKNLNVEECKLILKTKEWTFLLGQLMFGLSDSNGVNYSPTFRSLISYFIRLGHGAFEDPFKHFPNQKTWDIQVNNAFLLGLNWEDASEFQSLKDGKTTIDNLGKALKEGYLPSYLSSQGELEAEKIRLEDDVKEADAQLKSFKVHPQYFDIQERATSITSSIHDKTNKIILNQKILDKYQDNIVEEPDVSIEHVKKVYSDVGLIFPESLLMSLNNTIDFHQTIISNRKTYLSSEIEKIKKLIEYEKKEIERLSDERAELFQILETHGALEEYTLLQKKVLDLKQKIDLIDARIDVIKKIDDGKSTLKIKKEELLKKSRLDLEEREIQKKNVIRLFNQNSEYLYNNPGILSIDINDSGFKFAVEIQRNLSDGFGYMKILCYDLVIIKNLVNAEYSPGFLIHDSKIFDGVDERQIAKAIELAYQESQNNGFQYICAINSDRIPYDDFSEGFKEKFDNSIRIKFTDATEDGGLLGIRF